MLIAQVKIGKRYLITGNSNFCHFLEIGAECKVLKIEDGQAYMIQENFVNPQGKRVSMHQWVSPKDLEPIPKRNWFQKLFNL